MATMKTEAHQKPLGELDSKHRLIASDRVEGTAVMNGAGVKIGTIERVMIDKLSGQVAFAVMSFGGHWREAPSDPMGGPQLQRGGRRLCRRPRP